MIDFPQNQPSIGIKHYEAMKTDQIIGYLKRAKVRRIAMEGDYISFLYGQNIFLLFAGPDPSQELIAFEIIHFPLFYQDVDRQILLEAINESNVRHPMVKTRLTKDRAVSFTFEFFCTTPKIKRSDVLSILGMLECVADTFPSIITEVENQEQHE